MGRNYTEGEEEPAATDDSTETICVDAHNVSGTNGCHPYRSRHLETDIVTNDTEHYAPL